MSVAAGHSDSESNASTFPIENVKLRRTITPVCLSVSDQKFSEQLQCLKIFKTKPLSLFFKSCKMSSRWIWKKLSTSFRNLWSYDEKSCLVQTQVQLDFRQFQLTVRIRAWGLIHWQGKEQLRLKPSRWHAQDSPRQEQFCRGELVVSSNPRSDSSEPETAKTPFFLPVKSHMKRWLFDTLNRQPTWY